MNCIHCNTSTTTTFGNLQSIAKFCGNCGQGILNSYSNAPPYNSFVTSFRPNNNNSVNTTTLQSTQKPFQINSFQKPASLITTNNIIDINMSAVNYGEKVIPKLETYCDPNEKYAFMVQTCGRMLEDLKEKQGLERLKIAVKNKHQLFFVTTSNISKIGVKSQLLDVYTFLGFSDVDYLKTFRLFKYDNWSSDASLEEIL